MRTCANCRWFTSAPDLDNLPACEKHKIVLGVTRDDESARQDMFIAIGSKCPAFEQNMGSGFASAAPLKSIAVSIGANMTRRGEAADNYVAATAPDTCAKCMYYAPPDVVLKEMGWGHGMCTPNAALIPNRKRIQNATACGIGKIGPNATTTDGVDLHPMYGGVVTVNIARRRTDSLPQGIDFHTKTDPREWPTDRPVTTGADSEFAHGIVAWRRVVDPKGHGPDAFMPIFDHEHPEIREEDVDGNMIDPRDTYGDMTPWLYRDYAGLLYTACRTMLGHVDPTGGLSMVLNLVGESGTGKSEFWAYFAWLMNLRLVRINIRPSMFYEDLFGMPELVVGEDGVQVTSWIDGMFSRWYPKPCVILLDELNSASDDVMMTLRPSMDKGNRLNLEKANRWFDRSWACFIGLAMNPPSANYAGTRDLSLADKRRFRTKMVPMPDEDIEKEIIRSHCADADVYVEPAMIDAIVRIGNKFRAMYKERAISASWGVRENIAVAQLTAFFSLHQAYQMVALDMMEDEEAEPYLMQINSEVGEA